MTRFYVVRHGKSEYNLAHKITGQIDVDLIPEGRIQAYEAQRYFKRIKLDGVYSSDLKRAYVTASIICKGRGLKIHKSKKLRERTYGSLDGMISKEFRAKGYFTDDVRPFGGENEEDTGKRALRELKRIGDKEEGKKILIVCHDAFITCMLKQMDPERFKDVHDGDRLLNNCSTTTIDYEKGRFKILRVGYDDYINEKLG